MNKSNILFLATALTLGEGATAQDNFQTYPYIMPDTPIIVEQIIQDENQTKYNLSLKTIGNIEMEFFYNFFGLEKNCNPEIFVKKVKQLQKEFGFMDILQSGIITKETFKHIYTEKYKPEIEKLNHEAQKRLKIYEEMQGYNQIEKARNVYLNTFDNNIYYGNGIGENAIGTYINEYLVGKVPEELDKKENLISFTNISGKSVLTFYINGKLELATYVSPGTDDGKQNTPIFNTHGNRFPSLNHVSNRYPIDRNSEGKIIGRGGGVMPYSVHIYGSYRLHGSDFKIDGKPAGHGCILVPLYYMEHLYHMVSVIGNTKVRIDTRDVYSKDKQNIIVGSAN